MTVLVHEKVPFINVDQLLDIFKIYFGEFDWNNFARSSDITLSEFISETWPQSFKITACPNNNSEWISLTGSSVVIQDESFETSTITKKMKSNGYDKGLYDIGFICEHNIENGKRLKKQKEMAERILYKMRNLVPD